MSDKITPAHLQRKAIVYVRQSSSYQVQHNVESRRLQYAMQERVRSLGWTQVEVIDEDLGLSGASAADRIGFQRMVADVCLGNVGIIAALEVSRFARNNGDWSHLLQMCCLVHTLLADHETLYDPRLPNDRLLLGLKGSLSEYELDLLRQRALSARQAKASRGELQLLPPVGYVKSTTEAVFQKDPDQRIQNAIQSVFERFLALGSAHQTFRWFVDNKLLLPAAHFGATGWETLWRPPSYRRVLLILKNPTYAGAYTFGKTEQVVKVQNGCARKMTSLRSREQWSVLIQAHHEAYVSWETFERIQQMIAGNVPESDSRGAVRKGSALLAGMLRCRRCGRGLDVVYTGKNHDAPRYSCQRGRLTGAQPCFNFGGWRVDQMFSLELLRVLQPAAVEAALEVEGAQQGSTDNLLRALELDLQAARYAAQRAQKQYDATDPANRLVADELERRWNAALLDVQRLEAQVTQHRSGRAARTAPTRQELLSLSSQMSEIWNNPETSVQLKKRIVRTLIEEIVVDIDDQAREVVCVIHWKGGVHSNLRVPKLRVGQTRSQHSVELIEAIRTLAHVCKDETIALLLTRNQITTAHGHRWSRATVATLRSYQQIPCYTPERQEQEGWMKLREAAQWLKISCRALRCTLVRGEIKSLHPLPFGPWLINREALDHPDAVAALQRIRADQQRCQRKVPEAQLNLIIPNT